MMSKAAVMLLPVWICVFYAEETAAQVNLAFNKPALESSSYQTSYAYLANDGNRAAHIKEGTCTHTLREQVPWWTVDLKGNYSIYFLRIYNRDESLCDNYQRCAERLAGFRVHVSDHVSATVPSTRFKQLCHRDAETPVPAIIDVNCTPSLVGRYVTISLNQTSDQFLSLCEVEIYGHNVSSDTVVVSTIPEEATSNNTDLYVEQSPTSSVLALDTDKPVFPPLATTHLAYKTSEKQSVFETISQLDIGSVTDNAGIVVFPSSHDINKGGSFLLNAAGMEILAKVATEMTTSTAVTVSEMTTYDGASTRASTLEKPTYHYTSTGVSVSELTTYDNASAGETVPEITTNDDVSTGEIAFDDASTGESVPGITTNDDASTAAGGPEMATDDASAVVILTTYDDTSSDVSEAQIATYNEASTVPEMTTYGDASAFFRVPEMTTYGGASASGDASARVSVGEMTTYEEPSTSLSVPDMASSSVYPEYRRSVTEDLLMSAEWSANDSPQTLVSSSFSTSVQKVCRCSFRKQVFDADQASDKFMSSVLKELDIDRKTVTKERRKNISAQDKRKSSAAISVSFMVVTLLLCGIILCDLTKVMRDMKGHHPI